MIFASPHKLAIHERFARYIAGGRISCINMEISISSVCNAQCEMCFYRNGNKALKLFADVGKLVSFLADAYKNGLEAVTWTGGGEPALHPGFSEIVTQTGRHTALEQGLLTNALAISEYPAHSLKWIRISKTNKPWPYKNISTIRNQNKNVGLCVNYRGEVDDVSIEEGLHIARDLDLRYVQVRPALNVLGKTILVFPPKFFNDDKLSISHYKFEECWKQNRGYRFCEGHHFVPFIWEDGTVSACGYMRHKKQYNIGNIYSDSFSKLCVNMPDAFPVAEDCQVCCKNHEINKFISECKQLEDSKSI